MMRRLVGTQVLACLLLAGTASAQAPGMDASFLGGQTPSTGLLKSGILDLSRLDVSHSLSFASASGSAGSTSGGLWVTHLGYRLSNPLRVAVDLGAVINTTGDGAVLNEQNLFLKGFQLDYRPSRHFQLNVSYQNFPADASPALGYSAFGPAYRPWGSPLGIQQ